MKFRRLITLRHCTRHYEKMIVIIQYKQVGSYSKLNFVKFKTVMRHHLSLCAYVLYWIFKRMFHLLIKGLHSPFLTFLVFYFFTVAMDLRKIWN